MGRRTVSCTDIGARLALDPTQVRKDLESVGVAGKPRVGYVLENLIRDLERFLGWNNLNHAFLAGAGSMGSALLGNRKFEQCGLKIVAGFDVDPLKIGTKIHGTQILPAEKMKELAQRMRILIGILTVPATEAQAVADGMVAGGIRAIWNFAPVRLHVPEHVIVHDEDLYCSIAALSQKLFANLQMRPQATPAMARNISAAVPMR